MSNTYKNLKEYAFSEHKEAFQKLLNVFKAYSIKYFLIGAQARDLHFYQKHIKPVRATRDIDFAVMVESFERYQELLEAIKSEGFTGSSEPYRLIWSKGNTIIDLLPFGQLEEDHTINFKETEIELSVLGFQELNEELEEYYLDNDKSVSIPVPPLHGLFFLKLLAWDDKKAEREKDLTDIIQILDNYWEYIEEEAYKKHLDLFDDNNFDIRKAAARILGRKLIESFKKSELLKTKIIQILDEQSSQTDPPGKMLQKFAIETDQSIEDVKILLDEILLGISEQY